MKSIYRKGTERYGNTRKRIDLKSLQMFLIISVQYTTVYLIIVGSLFPTPVYI